MKTTSGAAYIYKYKINSCANFPRVTVKVCLTITKHTFVRIHTMEHNVCVYTPLCDCIHMGRATCVCRMYVQVRPCVSSDYTDTGQNPLDRVLGTHPHEYPPPAQS